MLIEIDFNHDDWREFADTIPEDCYEIVEDFWEDSEEWTHVRVLDEKWQTWISLKHPHWIIE
jgi:hypothetical protein